MKIGIIGGGVMGSALLKGVIDNGLIVPKDIYVAEIDVAKQIALKDSYKINIVKNISELAAAAQIIILAVKPNMITGVLQELEPKIDGNHLLISIAAGVTLASLEDQLARGRFIRVMPNTPARIGKGVSAYSLGHYLTAEDEKSVAAIFGCVGKTIKVPEHLLDAVTAVSGSGPAYVYYFIEAMVDAGVMLGLNRKDALILVSETFLGSTELLKEMGEDPCKLRNEVTSSGGTTAAALFELEKEACGGIIMKAVAAAAQKSKDLGKS